MMSPPKQLATVLGILVAVTVTSGGLAWHAARTTNDLRAQAEAVRGEIAAAESEARTPKFASVGQEAARSNREAPVVAPNVIRPSLTESAASAGPLDDPQAQALRLNSFRDGAALDYFSFGRAAGLNTNQYSRLLDLVVEHEARRLDLLAVAKMMALSTRDTAYATLDRQEQERHQSALTDLLGVTGTRQFEEYQVSAPIRKAVGELAGALALTSAPLQPEQSRQLVALLHELGFRDQDNDPALWDKLMARTQTILGPRQIVELQGRSVQQQGTDAFLRLSRLANQPRK